MCQRAIRLEEPVPTYLRQTWFRFSSLDLELWDLCIDFDSAVKAPDATTSKPICLGCENVADETFRPSQTPQIVSQ